MTKEHFPFDRTLRELIQRIPQKFCELVFNKKITKILDTSLPSVEERKADFIGAFEDGEIIHAEIQL